MEQITVRLPESMIEELEKEAEEEGVSRSEHIRDVLESRRDTERLRSRIETLEEQLARRSQVEEKVDVLAKRVEDRDEPGPPWPVRWWRWFRE